jgi:hypothetical protein
VRTRDGARLARLHNRQSATAGRDKRHSECRSQVMSSWRTSLVLAPEPAIPLVNRRVDTAARTEEPNDSQSDNSGRLARANSALNLKILCRRFAPVRDLLVFDDLPLIESGQTSAFDCRNVNKHILAAARRLNKSISLCRIEPLHSTLGHYLLHRRADRSMPGKKKDRLGLVAATAAPPARNCGVSPPAARHAPRLPHTALTARQHLRIISDTSRRHDEPPLERVLVPFGPELEPHQQPDRANHHVPASRSTLAGAQSVGAGREVLFADLNCRLGGCTSVEGVEGARRRPGCL